MGAGEPEEEGPGSTEGPGPYRERSPERSPAAFFVAYLGLTLEGDPQGRLATPGATGLVVVRYLPAAAPTTRRVELIA
jgi:hypothetical protein